MGAVEKTELSLVVSKGECELIGPENTLIPEGIYEASYLHFETSALYSKKPVRKGKRREGGKVYLWFWIDPYGNKIDPSQRVELYLSYNTAYVELPTGRKGKFGAKKKSKYYKDYKRLIGVARDDRISPNTYRNKLFKISVGTVTTNDRQKKHGEDEQYSVIREIIGITG